MSRLREYVDARDLTLNLTLRELRSRYKKSILGWTWSLINPLATMLIFTLVFSFFLRIKPPVGNPSGLYSFPMYLLCGLLMWNFFSGALGTSAESLISNANLVKKVYFPREIIVVSTVLSLLVSFCIEMSVLCVALLVLGNMVLPWIPVMVLLIAITSILVLGIGLIASAVNVYFRDVKYLIGILLQALFYTMPIVYPLRVVPVQAHILGIEVPFRQIYLYNPLARLVLCFQTTLYDLRFPAIGDLAYVMAWALGFLVLGLYVFRRLDRRFAEEL